MSNIPEFTVSQISSSIKIVVEDAFGYVKIKGEISGLKKAASGHVYFNLKDENALMNAVCFRNSFANVEFDVEDGLMVDAYGRVTTYGGRSSYQIVVEKLGLSGAGAIMQMLEKRKEKLAKEGLFDQKHKLELPFFPKRIGVVSSQTGAVIQDIINRVEARCPSHIMLYSSAVQGKSAASEVMSGLKYFSNLGADERPQVVIIARGGGSVEDLLPFSEESLVRMIHDYKIPVISAIGHETDFCLLDFAADIRAATPTAAAEMATVVLDEMIDELGKIGEKISNRIINNFTQKGEFYNHLSKMVKSPQQILQNMAQRAEVLSKNIENMIKGTWQNKDKLLSGLKIDQNQIVSNINIKKQQINSHQEVIGIKVNNFFQQKFDKLLSLSQLLKSNSHFEILNRGFAIVKDEKGNLVRDVGTLCAGQEIGIVTNSGELSADITKITKK